MKEGEKKEAEVVEVKPSEEEAQRLWQSPVCGADGIGRPRQRRKARQEGQGRQDLSSRPQESRSQVLASRQSFSQPGNQGGSMWERPILVARAWRWGSDRLQSLVQSPIHQDGLTYVVRGGVAVLQGELTNLMGCCAFPAVGVALIGRYLLTQPD